jgi:hypothetical protein
MATKNVESIGFAQNAILSDTTEYGSLVGFSALPNKILKILGRHIFHLTATGFPADLHSHVQAQLKIAAVNWKDNTGLDKNSAGFAFITNITNFNVLASSTVRGLIVGIRLKQSNANPYVFVAPFKMASGVLTLGTITETEITTALTNNNAYKLFVDMNSQTLTWFLRDTADTTLHTGTYSPNANYLTLTSQNLPESGYYIGSHSGIYTGDLSEGGNRLMFIDELQYYIG